MQTRKRAAKQHATSERAPKACRVGQKRVTVDPLPPDPKDEPALLVSGSSASTDDAGDREVSSQLQANSSDSSGHSAGLHVPPDDPHIRQPAEPAHRDSCAEAVAAAAAPMETWPLDNAAPAREIDIPGKVQVGTSATYLVLRRIGKGGFGYVYLGTRSAYWRKDGKPDKVAIKFEKSANSQAAHEALVYKALGDSYGLPRLHAKGTVGEWNVMIIELLGKSLWDLHIERPRTFPDRVLACIAIEAITMLQHMHHRGYAHGDVKPENLVLGAPAAPGDAPRLHLVDLGLTTQWRFKTGKLRTYSSDIKNFRGTSRYASLHAHLGRTPMPRDDLESLAYTLVFLSQCYLPWQGLGGDDDKKRAQVAAAKAAASAETLCQHMATPFKAFMDAVLSLRFTDEPAYASYIAMFRPLASEQPGPLPIAIGDLSVEPTAADEEDQPRKVTRQGRKSQQYLIVLDPNRKGKQRYHTGVTTTALQAFAEKAWKEKLRISAATADPSNTWSVVLSANTGFTEQAFRIESGSLATKWVQERWDQGFHITAVAGWRSQSQSLTVMSKGRGTPYTQQSYMACEEYPHDYIVEKWAQGYFVTSAGTCNGSWVIVVSKGAPFLRQVVELDYSYPSDAIHERWKAGYRITACASTDLQTAVFMSIPKRKPAGGISQETRRNAQWPADDISEKWNAGMHIADVAYGRCAH